MELTYPKHVAMIRINMPRSHGAILEFGEFFKLDDPVLLI